LLFQVAPSDSVTYGAVFILVMMSTGLAAYIPGRRAVRSNVSALLRNF